VHVATQYLDEVFAKYPKGQILTQVFVSVSAK